MPILPRPRFRLPLRYAVAIVLAIYLVRSIVRGFDFRLDMPVDAVAGVAFLVVLGIVAWLRAEQRRDAIAEADDDGVPPEPPTA